MSFEDDSESNRVWTFHQAFADVTRLREVLNQQEGYEKKDMLGCLDACSIWKQKLSNYMRKHVEGHYCDAKNKSPVYSNRKYI